MKILQVLFVLCISVNLAYAQQSDEVAVEKAVESLRQALIHPEVAQFDGIVAGWLSYGHSNNDIENKKQFIGSLLSKKYNFLDVRLSHQTLTINNNIAIVRHHFFATTHNKGMSPGTLKLGVLLVWQKIHGNWLLIARQACKI